MLDRILHLLICLYIIVLPLFPSKVDLGGRALPLADMLLGVTIIVYLFKLVVNCESRDKFISGMKDFFTDHLSIFMGILVLMMFASISYAVERKLALSESLRFVVYIIIFFIIKYENNSKFHIKDMIKSYIFTTSLLSLFGIYQYFTGFGLGEKFKNYEYAKLKVAATMENPNNLGAFLILAIFPMIMLAIYEKVMIKKLFYSALSLLILINMVLTGSRNAIIGIGIGIVVLALLYNFRLFILLAILGVISLFVPEIKERILAINDPTQNQSRVYLWEIAKRMIKDHPLFGVGNGNYVSLYDKYTEIYPQFKFYNYTRYPSHNSYLKVESELGVIGGVSFIGILVSALVKVKKFVSITEDKFLKFFYTGFLASMVAFYFMNLFDNLFFVPKTTAYFWILLAISQGSMFRMNSRGVDFY